MTSTRPDGVTSDPDGGPAIYRLAFYATLREGTGIEAYALVATASDAVAAVTVVERTYLGFLGGGVVHIEVSFRAINRNEAAETARRAMAVAPPVEPVDAVALWLGMERVPLDVAPVTCPGDDRSKEHPMTCTPAAEEALYDEAAAEQAQNAITDVVKVALMIVKDPDDAAALIARALGDAVSEVIDPDEPVNSGAGDAAHDAVNVIALAEALTELAPARPYRVLRGSGAAATAPAADLRARADEAALNGADERADAFREAAAAVTEAARQGALGRVALAGQAAAAAAFYQEREETAEDAADENLLSRVYADGVLDVLAHLSGEEPSYAMARVLAAGRGEPYDDDRHGHAARPDDDPEPGDRCKDCGRPVTWVGPSQYDWQHVQPDEGD